VAEAIGYACGFVDLLIALKRRSDGTVRPWPAAVVDASVGATYWPDLFFTSAVVKLFCRAYACSTYPTAPSVCFTAAATPAFLAAPVPVGHLTVLSEPTCLAQVGLESWRNVVNSFVVPDSSDRCTTVTAVDGSVLPGFNALIAGSFHFLTFPRKMLAIVAPSSLRPLSMPDTL
jgi:hypothetical protein